jgi:hypothetical protein
MLMLLNYTASKKIAIAALLLIVVACADDKVKSRWSPVVDTHAVMDVNESGATFNGEILDIGDGVSDHGFIYGSVEVDGSTALYLDSISLGPATKAGKFSMLANRNLQPEKTYYVRAFATSMPRNTKPAKIVLGQEVTFVSKGGLPSAIKDITPQEGVVGDTIIITGSGLGGPPGSNTVWFNKEYAKVVRSSSSRLWAIVPLTAALNENIITVKSGTNQVIASQKFKLLTATLTSFEPTSVTFGDTLILHGTNFPLDPLLSSVTNFARHNVLISSTRTTITSVVPQNVSQTSSPVGLTIGVQNITLPGPIQLKAPVITSFTPTSGHSGTFITITGNFFCPNRLVDNVMLGNKTAIIDFASVQKLQVEVPYGLAPGTYSFSVTVLGQTGVSPVQFQVN